MRREAHGLSHDPGRLNLFSASVSRLHRFTRHPAVLRMNHGFDRVAVISSGLPRVISSEARNLGPNAKISWSNGSFEMTGMSPTHTNVRARCSDTAIVARFWLSKGLSGLPATLMLHRSLPGKSREPICEAVIS